MMKHNNIQVTILAVYYWMKLTQNQLALRCTWKQNAQYSQIRCARICTWS